MGICLSLLLLAESSTIWAQQPPSTPTQKIDPASIDPAEFDRLCKDVLSQEQQITQASQTGQIQASPELQAAAQKLSYCQAASDAKDAYEANASIWKVWAGVAAVCGAACAASMTGVFTNQYICMGVNVSALAYDSIKTQQFTSLLTQLPMIGVGVMMNANTNSGVKSTNAEIDEKIADLKKENPQNTKAIEELEKKKEKKKDLSACLTTATAIGTTFMKKMSEESALQSLQQSLASILSLSAVPNTQSVSAVTPSLPELGATPENQAIAEAIARGENLDAQTDSTTSSGSACGSASSAGAVIACAVARDSNLPPFVRTPKFAEEVGKFTGLSPDQFFGGSNSAQGALMGALGGSLGRKDPMKLSDALNQMGTEAQASFGSGVGATYAGGGGGGFRSAGGGGDSVPDFGAMMGGIMGAFGPKDGKSKEDRSLGVSTVIFALKQGKPWAALPEERGLSLFDRVTFRYWERVKGGVLPNLSPYGVIDDEGNRIENPAGGGK